MGQANKKKRDCPVVGHVITPAECGANRAGAYACPADCPHNPWGTGHYNEALAIEDKVDALMMRRLFGENGGRPAVADMNAMNNNSQLHRHYHFIRRFQLDRDKQGRNFVERWQVERFAGLNNDEINMLRWKTQSGVRLLELQRVGPQEGICEAVDLLDPARGVMRIMDQAFYSRASRFQHVLAWNYEMPHYTRVLGIGLPLPPIGMLHGEDMIRLIVEHLGGPTRNGEVQPWMAEHFLEVAEAMDACQEALYQQMIKNTDLRYVSTVYEIRGTLKDLLQRLDSCNSIEAEPSSPKERAAGFIQRRTWIMDPATESELAAGKPDRSPGRTLVGSPVLGSVLCGLDKVQLEASAIDRGKVLRKKFEELAGNLVSMRSTHELDMGAQTLAQRQPYNKKLVPDGLLRHATTMLMGSWRTKGGDETTGASGPEEIMRNMDESFLDIHVPVLNNLTPREAASDPEVRPLLVRLIKARVSNTDQQNLRNGTNYDCNWLVKELGLTEILIEPPPCRTTAPDEIYDDDDNDDDDAAFDDLHATTPGEPLGLDMSLPPSPPLPPKPFTDKELDQRHQIIINTFRKLEELHDSFSGAAPDLINTLDAAMPEDSSDEEFAIMLFMAANVWSIFAPPGTRGWLIDDAAYRHELSRQMKRYLSVRTEQEFNEFVSHSRQPALISHIADMLQQMLESARKNKAKIGSTASVVLFLMMSVLIDELDKAARQTAAK